MQNEEYKREDFTQMSWGEYGEILETAYKKLEIYLKDSGTKIDSVVPIFRGGAIPGAFFAYKLHLLKIIPVQFKYLQKDGKLELKNLTKTPDEEFKISENPTFLVVENNRCSGSTTNLAIEHIKKIVPGCKIIFISIVMDYSYQDVKDVEVVIYGKLSNETRTLDESQAKEKGISNLISLFPWEDIEEEWAIMNGKEFSYN